MILFSLYYLNFSTYTLFILPLLQNNYANVDLIVEVAEQEKVDG